MLLRNNLVSIPYRLKFALESWREWDAAVSSAPQVLQKLGGGKTNSSWLVETQGNRFVARLNNPISGLLGIDRRKELAVHQAVASIGLAPKYVYLHAPSDTSVFKYLEGRTLSPEELSKNVFREELEAAVSRYQKIQVDVPRFNYPYYLTRYWKKIELVKSAFAKEHLLRWQEFTKKMEGFDSRSWRPVISHHDLEPENILTTHNGIKIIDWEYAGNGHPDFDRISLNLDTIQPQELLREIHFWLNLLWSVLYEYGHGSKKQN